jgi:hypothetical protein
MSHSPIMTVQQHILEEQRRLRPGASGEFSWLLSGITLATKIIADQVRRAGLVDILGSAGGKNVQGEVVQKLDVLANHALLQCLGKPRQCRRHGLRGKRGAGRRAARLAARQLRRRLRSARRVQQHRRQCQRRHDFLHPPPPNPARRTAPPSTTCCNPASSRSRPAMSSTAPRPCSSTPPTTASTASRSIPRSAPISSAIRTSRCRTTARPTPSTKPTPTAFRSRIAVISRICGPGRRAGSIRRATSARWSPTSIAPCSKAASFFIRRRACTPMAKLRLMYEANPIALLAEQAKGAATDGNAAHPGEEAAELARTHDAAGRQPHGDGFVARFSARRVIAAWRSLRGDG